MRTLYLVFLLCGTASTICAQEYKLGELLEGGVIFYISENKDTLLTCGLRDQGTGVTWSEAIERCERSFSIQDGTLYWGWRLPDKREIQIMRRLRDFLDEAILKAGGEAFNKELGAYYWSSTEIDANYAWLMPFGFDRIQHMTKGSNLFDARPVRAVVMKK